MRAVGIHLQQDLAELVGRGETRLGDNRGVELLVWRGRRAAELTRRDLGVLGVDGANDIDRRQLVVIQLGRVHPDTHRILRTEDLGIAHAWRTADRVLDIRCDEVGDIVLGH